MSFEKAYSTWYSQAVSHPSTNQAQPCLASEFRRDRAAQGGVAVSEEPWNRDVFYVLEKPKPLIKVN